MVKLPFNTWYWLFALFVLKLLLCLWLNPTLAFNPDEQTNYQIALNYTNGYGYSLYDPDDGRYELKAYHGSFTVFLYRLLIFWSISPKSWVLFVLIVAALLGTLSVSYCYRLALLLSGNRGWAVGSAVVYALYPSVFYFIGSLFAYENLAMPMLVIVIYRLFVRIDQRLNWTEMAVLALLMALSCLLRGQLLLIYGVVIVVFLSVRPKALFSNGMALSVVIVFLMFLAHLPILRKNHAMFGAYLLSTQPGFELLQGFHPAARGSWMGNCCSPESALYQYVHSRIPHIKQLNEWEESQARQELALEWIRQHPVKAMLLLFRKMAIYWLPKNYEVRNGSDIINPVTALVHLLCIGYIALLCFGRTADFRRALVLLSPILGSLLLSLIFFVGYRWRYYAEPFMVILAVDAMRQLFLRFNFKSISRR